MAIFNFNRKPQNVTIETRKQEFSTPFMKVGKGNIALPYVSNYQTKGGAISFGSDNLFPQLLNQMYYTSPIHGAIIDFTVNAVIGGGLKDPETDGRELVEFKTFLRKNKVEKQIKLIARDWKLHARVHLLIKFSDSGQPLSFRRIDPSAIRYRKDGDYDYSFDWSTNQNRKTYKKYRPDLTTECNELLYTYEDVGAGQDYYPIPTYSSALNWIFLDGEQSVLHKANIQNSIFPSLIIRRPKRFGSKEEIQNFQDGITGNKGAENAGNIMVLTGDGFDNTPEAQTIEPNNNDKLFIQTSQEIKDNICFAHKINPSIMGVKVAGSLGNAKELEMAYSIWEKNVVIPDRLDVEEVLNDIRIIFNVKHKLELIEYSIIEQEIKEESKENNVFTPETPSDKEASARATLRGSVGGVQGIIQIQESVAQGLADRQSAAALLELIYGFSPKDSLRLLGDVTKGSAPQITQQQQGATQMESNTALRGLSAKENMDIIRIVRDFEKGRLVEPLARTRLAAYGISEEIINELMSHE